MLDGECSNYHRTAIPSPVGEGVKTGSKEPVLTDEGKRIATAPSGELGQYLGQKF